MPPQSTLTFAESASDDREADEATLDVNRAGVRVLKYDRQAIGLLTAARLAV